MPYTLTTSSTTDFRTNTEWNAWADWDSSPRPTTQQPVYEIGTRVCFTNYHDDNFYGIVIKGDNTVDFSEDQAFINRYSMREYCFGKILNVKLTLATRIMYTKEELLYNKIKKLWNNSNYCKKNPKACY